MSRVLHVRRSGPGLTVQDLGRPGYLLSGLSRGGAADRLAIWEGAALLGQSANCAALEMAGMGGEFEAGEDMRIALTGAPMRASLDGGAIAWNASHLILRGARLSIGAVERGCYGYLHVGGGFETPVLLGSRSAHLAAGILGAVPDGAALPVGPDAGAESHGMKLEPVQRFSGGEVRIVPSLQTGLFPDEELARFEAMAFRRDTRGNRMGVRLLPEGESFGTCAGLSVLSEVIAPGDVQITGDGTPFVLLAECQTTGGYPRIGTVLPADLPRVAQAAAGETLRFRFVTLDEAVEIERKEAAFRKGLSRAVTPLVRRPEDIPDLLAYQLIGGVTAGDDAG